MVLARVLAAGEGGLTRSTLLRDLQPLVAHRLAPGEWRLLLDRMIELATARGHLRPAGRGRVVITPDGRDAVCAFLGSKPRRSITWPELKNGPLVARALGGSATRLKPLDKAHGLRAAIIDRGFSLKLRSVPAPARLREALARRAARDGKIPSANLEPSNRAAVSRQHAASLLTHPRPVESDAELISLIAADQAGSVSADVAALRLHLLRRLMFEAGAEGSPAAPVKRRRSTSEEAVAADRPDTRAAEPPDPERFADAVRSIAREVAQGWSGNRRAYISHVWKSFSIRHANWRMAESDFKSMLSEAHRAGRLQLTNADLRDRRNLTDVQASAVAYMNSVWHFIRVEDE